MTIILPDPKKCSKCGSTNSRKFHDEFVEGVECKDCLHRAALRVRKTGKDYTQPESKSWIYSDADRTF